MKKLITAATNGIEKLQKLIIGLDLGDRFSHYGVLDESGRILAVPQDFALESRFNLLCR